MFNPESRALDGSGEELKDYEKILSDVETPDEQSGNSGDSDDKKAIYTKRFGEDLEHVVGGLEKKFMAMQFFMGKVPFIGKEDEIPLKIQTRWQDVDEQFRRRLSAILAREDLYPTADVAWKRFKKLEIKRVSTQEQREAMDISEEQFTALFNETRNSLKAVKGNMQNAVRNALGAHKTSEAKYGEQTKRNYERLVKEGITFTIPEAALEVIREKVDPNSNRPILEQLKTDPFLAVEGLDSSKISLAVHDMYDHLWLMHLMHKSGVFQRYEHFIKSIGDPYWRDVFGREGEVIASIGYSFRYWNVIKQGIEPYFRAENLESILNRGIQRLQAYLDRYIEGNYEPKRDLRDNPGQYNHDNLVQRLKNLKSAREELAKMNPLEKRAIAFGYSNYVVEYLEQIRKHGNVKYRSESGEFIQKLSNIDPEMLALFVEGFQLLQARANRSEDVLLKLILILEEKLTQAVEGNQVGDFEFTLKIEDIKDPTNMPDLGQKNAWFKENLGFAAIRNIIAG